MSHDSHDEPSPRPVRGELFADPGAKAVWAAILALPAAMQHEVLAELQQRLGVAAASGSDARIARAIAALREAEQLLGHSPSVNEYRRLHESRRELGWPPDGSIRRWLGGSWNDCLRQAMLSTVPDGDAIVIPLGPKFERAEIIEAVEQCAAELGRIPSLSDYKGWSRRPDVKSRPGRRPTSQGPIDRELGGWINALAAAGVVTNADVATVAPASSRVRAGNYFQTPERCIEALQDVAGRIGHSPTTIEYKAERTKIIAESEAEGQLRTIPSYEAIHDRWPIWEDALAAAGLESTGGRRHGRGGAPRGRKAPRVSEAHILDAIREAFAALGHPFTSQAYKAWRLEQTERDQAAGILRTLPSYHTIWQRYGTWEQAVNAALAMNREDDQDDDAAAGAVIAR
jgi:hypothetical protein